jgi:hypothetical protein
MSYAQSLTSEPVVWHPACQTQVVWKSTTATNKVYRQLVVLPTALLLHNPQLSPAEEPPSAYIDRENYVTLSEPMRQSGIELARGAVLTETSLSDEMSAIDSLASEACLTYPPEQAELCASPDDFERIGSAEAIVHREVILEGSFRTVADLLHWKGHRRYIHLAQIMTETVDAGRRVPHVTCELLCFSELPTRLGTTPRTTIAVTRATGVTAAGSKLMILEGKNRCGLVSVSRYLNGPQLTPLVARAISLSLPLPLPFSFLIDANQR